MVTTIQLNEGVKMALENMKCDPGETYEEVIVKLMNNNEKQKRLQRELLIEGCKTMAKDSLRITKEFEHIDSEIDIEW
ncbi:MAG: hypothetical protein ABIH25_04340 [Candidatus Woesearchaeota archaeon]